MPSQKISDVAAQLSVMTSAQLNERYLNASAGAIPDGESEGTPVFLPGTIFGKMVSSFGGKIWKGKVFTRWSPKSASLVNKILGLRFGKAQVSPGTSWMDGKPAVEIEYLGSSILFFWIHDEIRRVDEDEEFTTYLGRAYLRLFPGVHVFGTWFILSFPKSQSRSRWGR
jgi:hypothetical protein